MAEKFARASSKEDREKIVFAAESWAKEKGEVRMEGKEYVVNDGDVMLFRFNV